MKRSTFFVLLLLNISALLFAWLMIIPYAQITWDEAVFLLRASHIHELIRAGNGGGIVANIFDQWQFSYPPLQELYIAIATQWSSQFSIPLARISNTVWLFVTSYVLFLFSKSFSQKNLSTRAILANLFLVTSPLILFFSGIAMKETMSTAFVVASIYLYIQAIKQPSHGKFFSTGVFIGCSFLVRYQLVYTIVATILLNQLILFCSSNKKGQIISSTAAIFLPFLIIVVTWLFLPVNHVNVFLTVMSNTFNFTGGLTEPINYLLFHLRGIIYMYAPSVPFGCLYLFSLFWTMKYARQSIIRVPLLYIWINIIISTVHYINIQERYILPAMPFVFFLSSVTLCEVSANVYEFLQNKRLLFLWHGIIILILGISIGSLFQLPLRVYQTGSISSKGPIFTQSDYKDSWFSVDRTGWPKKLPWNAHEKPLDVINFVADNIDVRKPFWLYGESGYFSSRLFQLIFENRRDTGQTHAYPHDKYAIVIRILPESFYLTRDVQRVTLYKQFQADGYIRDPMGKILASRLFPELGIEAIIYEEFY